MTPYRTSSAELAIPPRVRRALLQDEVAIGTFRQSETASLSWIAVYAITLVACLLVPLPWIRARTALERLPSAIPMLAGFALLLWRRPTLAVVTTRRVLFVRHWPFFLDGMPLEAIVAAKLGAFTSLKVDLRSGGKRSWLLASYFTPREPHRMCDAINSAVADRKLAVTP